MKYKTKSIIKKVALALAGIVAVSAVGVGVAKLVEYMQDDLKTISPSFDVGNLGADGKYVNDESTLYTKEAFQCDGLQIKLDFDNEIDYQIYFYDDLDNFIESTEVLSAAYSETVHDGYARIVIIPNNDEDDKIGLTERLTYPGQMTIKVAKEQNVEYINVFNKRLFMTDNISALRFNHEVLANHEGSFEFTSSDTSILTSQDLLCVNGGDTITFTPPTISDGSTFQLSVFELKLVSGVVKAIKYSTKVESIKLSDDTDFVLLQATLLDSDTPVSIDEKYVGIFASYFTITK